jgi:hypothetical protein
MASQGGPQRNEQEEYTGNVYKFENVRKTFSLLDFGWEKKTSELGLPGGQMTPTHRRGMLHSTKPPKCHMSQNMFSTDVDKEMSKVTYKMSKVT